MKTNTNTNQELVKYINDCVSGSPDGGHLDIGSLQKMFKDIGRNEIIQLVKNHRSVTMVAGRRGGHSRATWGNEVPKTMSNPRRAAAPAPVAPSPSLSGLPETVDVEIELFGQKRIVQAKVLGLVHA